MKKSNFFDIDMSDFDSSDKGSVLIVDGTNLFIRSFTAYPTINDNGVHIGGFFGFLDTLVRMVQKFNCKGICICFDGDNSSSRRKRLHPEYKANRKATTKLNRNIPHTPEQEKELLQEQMELLTYYLNKMPVKLFQLSGVEADDVISYLVTNYYNEEEDVIILSSDKDFMQLLDNDNLKLVSPIKSKGIYPTYTKKEVIIKYGVHPSNMVLARSFEGDTSDNIKGVSGIGIKTLVKYFPELSEDSKYDVDYITNKASQLLENKKSKQLQNIVESKEIIDMNTQLMDLRRSSNFSITAIEAIDSIMSTKKEKPDFKQLRGMVRNHGLNMCIITARRVDFIELLRPIFSLYNK